MTRENKEAFVFDEAKLAEEMGTTVEIVALSCRELANEHLIEYEPPLPFDLRFATRPKQLSKARLPQADWEELYNVKKEILQ
jgi:hypothetical protein